MGTAKSQGKRMYIGCEELVAMKQVTTNSDTHRERGREGQPS